METRFATALYERVPYILLRLPLKVLPIFALALLCQRDLECCWERKKRRAGTNKTSFVLSLSLSFSPRNYLLPRPSSVLPEGEGTQQEKLRAYNNIEDNRRKDAEQRTTRKRMRLRFTASIGSDYGRSSHISPKVCSFQSNPTRLTFNLIDFLPINWLFSVADNGDTKWKVSYLSLYQEKKRARDLYTLCASVFEERGHPSGLSSGEYLKSTRRRRSAPPSCDDARLRTHKSDETAVALVEETAVHRQGLMWWTRQMMIAFASSMDDASSFPRRWETEPRTIDTRTWEEKGSRRGSSPMRTWSRRLPSELLWQVGGGNSAIRRLFVSKATTKPNRPRVIVPSLYGYPGGI